MERDPQGPSCMYVCPWSGEKCVIKHIRSFHQDYKTFPSPIVSAWLDNELSVLSATSWVWYQAGGSINTRVEEQSWTGAVRGTFFLPVSIWFGSITEPILHDLEAELMWAPGGGACLSDRQADGPTLALKV